MTSLQLNCKVCKVFIQSFSSLCVKECFYSMSPVVQVLDSSGLELKTAEGQMVMDLILNMAEIVRNHEKEVMNLAEETNTRLDQALALGRLQNLAAQVLLFF